MNLTKKSLLIGVLIISVVFLALFTFFKKDREIIQSFKFKGTIKSIEGNIVISDGSFVVEGKDGLKVSDVRILIGANTELKRVVANLPFTEEQIKAFLKEKQMVPAAKLDREETVSSLDKLTQDFQESESLDLTIISTDNIYGFKEISPNTMTYFLPVGVKK